MVSFVIHKWKLHYLVSIALGIVCTVIFAQESDQGNISPDGASDAVQSIPAEDNTTLNTGGESTPLETGDTAEDTTIPLADEAAPKDEQTDSLLLQEESTLTFTDPNGDLTADSPTSIRSLLRAVVSLVVVLGLILGVLYMLKRFWRKKESSSIISVLSVQTIQNNRNILIVSIAESLYVMSSSEAGIQLITEITDEDTKNFIRTNAQSERGSPFATLLAKYFPDQQKKATMHTQLEGLRKRSEKLKQYE